MAFPWDIYERPQWEGPLFINPYLKPLLGVLEQSADSYGRNMMRDRKVPPPAMGEPTNWWRGLPAEQAAAAPMVPTPTADGGRTWGEFPFDIFTQGEAQPPPVEKVTTPPINAGASTDVGAQPIPSAPIEAATPAAASGYSPDMGMALMRMGLQMMQPIQPGQTTVGHIAQAGLGGIDYLEAKRQVRAKEALAARGVDLEGRKTKAAERQVDLAEKKDKELTPGQKRKTEAEAKKAEATADLLGRSAGRGNAGKFKTKQDLKANLIGKLDLTLLEPGEIPAVLANINELVAGSGLPDTPTASAPGAVKGGKKPWPKTAKEAIKEIKASSPNLSPSQKLMLEAELKKRYPDYQVGTFDR